jgi:hypothetical protein
MGSTVQSRLDDETLELLTRLKQQGWTTSDVVRKGIYLVAREAQAMRQIRIAGMGEFDSGIPDLASNKKHLEGLGRTSMAGGKRRRGSRGR